MIVLFDLGTSELVLIPSSTPVPLPCSTYVVDGAHLWSDATGDHREQANHHGFAPLEAGGTVSLRARAADEDGNTVEQVILDAYRLRDAEEP